MSIKIVLVLGAGTMGQMVAQLCLEHGFRVKIHDALPESLELADKIIRNRLDKRVTSNELAIEDKSKQLKKMSFHLDPAEAARGVDLISESVPEDPKLKGKVFNTFHELCEPETLFTTNTSSLKPSQFAEASGRPDKLCALHFHDTRVTKIVDVMPHQGTSPDTITKVTAFTKSLGQIPIVLEKENNGYVFNNMLMSVLSSALGMAQKKVTSIENIDRSWMGVMQTDIGPFGIMDFVGLETVWKITDHWAEKRKDLKAKANADFVKTYLDQGKKGAKSGEGFYRYPNPVFKQPDFLE